MSQESEYPIPNNSNVCEAAGCSAKATLIIEVKVGERGSIPLSLCSKCVSKFEDIKADQKAFKPQMVTRRSRTRNMSNCYGSSMST